MEEEPLITVKQGKLIGITAAGLNGVKYFKFLGVPYAKPPIGNLRFKAPQPASSWEGILDATSEKAGCFAPDFLTQSLGGSEDCLYLNIHTPNLPQKNDKLKPVMVWINGGGFLSGSGNSDLYGTEYLIKHDVVIVTFNYRVGLLGFLNFKNPLLNISGNAGLKDQVLALKWVQENIENFNGDPENVTIFGESAGAASVHFLMLSPMTKGLFHRAIIQSGSAVSFWSVAEGLIDAIAVALNINKNNEEAILLILEKMNSNELLQLQNSLNEKFIPSCKRIIGPVIETPSSEPAFLLEEPINIITSGNYAQVPLVIGFCSREGMMYQLLKNFNLDVSELKTDKEAFIPHTLKVAKGSALSKKIGHSIQAFYKRFANEKNLSIEKSYILLSDILINVGIYSAIKNHLNTHLQPIYLYMFSVGSDLNILKKYFGIQETGACHCDDLAYLFKMEYTPKVYPGSLEYEAIYRFTKLWTTFAKTGNPNPVENDTLINITWKPIEKDCLHFLDINENLTVGINPDSSRMKFWNNISTLAESIY